MKKLIPLVTVLLFSTLAAQLPGGVTGEDLWYKTDASAVSGNQYQDYGPNAYSISANGTIQAGLFNFNHSLNFGGGYLRFPYSVEDMKVATIFMVYTCPAEANLSLIHSEWTSGGYDGNGTNEKRFSYTTQKLEKEEFTLSYPEDANESVQNALINTLNWFDFNSDYINNAMGTGGESTVFIGKSNPGAAGFSGSIPEFLIYRKALSKEERQRIESYLAIKYGITLTKEVGYYNSNYDEIWKADNNIVFGNRIFAIGRDDVSGLYQKQSRSSHTENDELILNAGELEETNEENISVFDNDHYIFIGDNDGDDDPEDVGDWELHPLDRVWLVHPYGETAGTITTGLRYNAAHLFDRIHQDYDQTDWGDISIWLLINRDADEQQEGNFDFNQVEAYKYHAVEGDHIVYYNQKWDEDNSGFDQFTFAIAPKLIVNVHLHEMECEDEEGDIDVNIKFGEPDFDVEIFDENDLPVDSQTDWPTRTVPFTSLPNGWYTAKVTDSTNVIRIVEFEVSPTAGMYVGLEDEYVLNPDVTIDASEHVTAQNITYEWFRDDVFFSSGAVLNTDKPGHYKVVLTNPMGCTAEAETDVVISEGMIEKESQKELPTGDFATADIRIYPNPTRSNQEFTVEMNLIEKQDVQIQIYDMSGRLIHNEDLKEISDYKWNHRIFQSGSYLISVTAKDRKYSKKIIIQ